jgi:CMP/dCMP kinase
MPDAEAFVNIVTITREYGAGGREVARRLVEALGWELLDRELLHQAAEIEHVPDAELERLDEKAIGMADHLRLHPPHQKYLHGLTAVVAQAAQRGNVVLVGRGTRYLVGAAPGAFHLRLVAPKEWRARRMAGLEGLPVDQALARCTTIDRIRDHFHRYFFGSKAILPAEYDLVVNTARVPLDDVAAVVAAVVREAHADAANRPLAGRVLTLARELGAGERGFAPTLAERLQMRVYDRELLEEQAVRMGIPESELEKVDEHPPGVFQRFRPGNLYQRYRDALERLMHQLAAGGDVILVGRGGSRYLREVPSAFHVRLVAPMPARVRRVMEFYWVRENVAKKRIFESDAARSSFFESYFAADWSSPLEYHITVNSGRLGATAVELVAAAAERHWNRTCTDADVSK